MTTNPTVTVSGIEDVKEMVRRLERAGIHTMPVFRGIGARMRRIQLNHFKTQENADGSPWPPLSEATKNRPGRGGDSSEPLKDKGLMFGSIHYQANVGGAIVGTNDPKARFHNEGGEGDRPPMREFIYLTDNDQNFLVDVLYQRTIKDPIEGS